MEATTGNFLVKGPLYILVKEFTTKSSKSRKGIPWKQNKFHHDLVRKINDGSLAHLILSWASSLLSPKLLLVTTGYWWEKHLWWMLWRWKFYIEACWTRCTKHGECWPWHKWKSVFHLHCEDSVVGQPSRRVWTCPGGDGRGEAAWISRNQQVWYSQAALPNRELWRVALGRLSNVNSSVLGVKPTHPSFSSENLSLLVEG